MSQPAPDDPAPPARRPRRPRWRTLLGLALAAVIAFPTLNRWNPRYSLWRLHGLTSQQVIARLGTPDYDTRRDPNQPYNDPNTNFTLGYHSPLGVIHKLNFEHDHLSDVEHWSK